MGHDITTLCSHNLDISSVEALAHDLAERLDINIEYGYITTNYSSDFLGSNLKGGEFVCFGTILKKPNETIFRLKDNNYELKKYYELYSDAIFDNTHYWWDFHSTGVPSDAEKKQEKEKLLYQDYELYKVGEGNGLIIANEIVNIDFDYLCRWWAFCRIFTEDGVTEEWALEALPRFRKQTQYYTEKLGGDKVYFLDDQSSVMQGVGQGGEYDMTWQELEQFVYLQSRKLLLDIPRYYLEDAYRDTYFNKEKYPLAFVDDFRDLKM
jgi:hypothetical protein